MWSAYVTEVNFTLMGQLYCCCVQSWHGHSTLYMHKRRAACSDMIFVNSRCTKGKTSLQTFSTTFNSALLQQNVYKRITIFKISCTNVSKDDQDVCPHLLKGNYSRSWYYDSAWLVSDCWWSGLSLNQKNFFLGQGKHWTKCVEKDTIVYTYCYCVI